MRFRWFAAAVVLVATAILLTVMSPALRDDPLSDAGPQPAPTASTSASPSASPSPSLGPPGCPVSDKLIPECGKWWGVAPGALTSKPPAVALAEFERKTLRRADIYHRYHRGDKLFPTPDEIRAARDPKGPRVLLINWKVAWGTTWADVAAGGQDARIDRLAAHIKKNFPEPFFLAIHHEPENEVDTDPRSGMTATDYAKMFRHTVQRLRAKGVTNAVFVMIYMGYQGWGVKDWFDDLYPGDDVVDWIGFDPYVTANPNAGQHGDFATLVNQTTNPDVWPGFYNWAVAKHPNKPLMLSEWGVFEYPADPSSKAEIFASVTRQVDAFPALKALVYFDSPNAPKGDTRVDSSPAALEAFRAVAAMPLFSIRYPDCPEQPIPGPSGSPSTLPSPVTGARRVSRP